METENITYTKKEQSYYNELVSKLFDVFNQREAKYAELDDMNYEKYYETNAKAGNAYLRPKKNLQDTRIVTGTTLEKENTLLSTTLNYDFKSSITAFDENNLVINRLGTVSEELIKKSEEIEGYDDKRALIYKEAFDQGTWYTEELYNEYWRVDKNTKQAQELLEDGEFKIKNINWGDKMKRVTAQCETNLIPGIKVYLGNMREFFIKKQPYLFYIDTIPYAEAKSLYGQTERWQYVPKKVKRIMQDGNIAYRDYSEVEMFEDMVEVIKYQNKVDNEFMLMLNGVMMLPIGFPLTAISLSGEYTLVKGDVEPISEFFAISKSIPAKTKVDQEVLDDTTRTLVLRMRQLLMPPMANNTNSTLSDKIFYPGEITNDINPTQLQKILGENNTISGAEFQIYSLIREIIDEKTVNPVFSGQEIGHKATATEINTLKSQAMMKLGLTIFGIIRYEKQRKWLRLQNILANWTKKIDSRVNDLTKQLEDIYMKIDVDTIENETGEKITRKIEFKEGELPSNVQVDAENQILSTPAKTVRKIYLNPKILRDLKLTFFIKVEPIPKNADNLERVLFEETVMKAAQMYGIQSLNENYVKHRWALLADEDPEQLWAPPQPPQMAMMPGAEGAEGAPPQGQPNPVGRPMGSGAQPQPGRSRIAQQLMERMGKPKQPSLNTLSQ